MRFAKGPRAALLATALAAAAASAAPQLPYQGRLDRDGVPQTGTFDFRFRLYQAPAAGTAVWTGDHLGVTVVGGAFTVKLGSTSPLDDSLLAMSQLYLEISVKRPSDGAFTTLKGRQQLLHVPYAATSSGDFRVNGGLIVGQSPDGGALTTDGGVALSVVGPSSNGTTRGGLKVSTSGGGTLLVDGTSVESSGTLAVQPVGKRPTTFGGPIDAPNIATRIFDGMVDINSAGPQPSFSIPLAGAGRIYKLYFQGQINSNNGSDCRLLMRFDNTTSSYRSYVIEDGDNGNFDWETTGIHLGRNVYARPGDMLGEFLIGAGGITEYTQVTGSSTVNDSNFDAASGVWTHGRAGGWWWYRYPSSLQLTTSGNGRFVGRVTLYVVN